MNCDDYLPALETGGFLRRQRARLHAVRCPRCATASAAFAAVKQQLAVSEPLSPHARQLWERAASELALQASRRHIWIPLAGGLAGACLLLIVMKWLARPEPAGVRTRPQPVAQIVVEEVTLTAELSRLAKATDQLDKQLQWLKEQAARRDAQQQVALTLNRFGRW